MDIFSCTVVYILKPSASFHPAVEYHDVDARNAVEQILHHTLFTWLYKSFRQVWKYAASVNSLFSSINNDKFTQIVN